ncbi:MAG: UDP-N-acetylglucosamine 4,6-dehydratase [Alphaproteobacteria bacterium]|nr:UDP-N-acetylglucosamine 4,6-dehydratase [Alphaproteobacteria bacterium]
MTDSPELLARILGRAESMFAEDIASEASRLAEAIDGKRFLVTGAAGSIGAAFVREMVRFRPARLHLVDISENGLVELVRELRSSPTALPRDFLTASLDYGGPEFARFALDHAPYDALINFSALKHVRAERDVYSLMRMIEVNVESLKRSLDLSDRLGLRRAFSVSTDKSVRPANLMGASKNLMEKVLFRAGLEPVATSARFANVAFSGGSLLEGFEQRLKKGQPLSAPSDVRRYFISEREAGELCLLACFLAERRQVLFPKLDAERHLLSLADIATQVLAHRGLTPHLCGSEEEAIHARNLPKDRWPCYFSASDTTGEKMVEEFHRLTDVVDTTRFRAAGVAREEATEPKLVDGFLAEIARLRASSTWKKADVVAAIRAAVPELEHHELDRNLDQKM